MQTSVITLEAGHRIPVKEEQEKILVCNDCHKKHEKLYFAGNQWRCFFCYAFYGWYSNGEGKPGPLELKEKQVKQDGTIIQRTERKADDLLKAAKITQDQYEAFQKLYVTDQRKARKFLRKAVRNNAKVN